MNKEFRYLCALIFGVALSVCAMAENIPDFPFLVAQGNAEIHVKPDVAKIAFSITEFNKDSKVAVETVAKRAQAIVDFAKKLGIEQESINSAEYNKSTKRKQDEHYENLEILGYEVYQYFTIDIKNISLYSPLVDQLISTQNISDIRTVFSVSNKSEIERDLVKQATVNAKQKASDLAEGMGVKLGQVFAVSQDRHFASVEAVFGIYPIDGAPAFMPPPELKLADSVSASMFVPKSIEFSKSVSVIFKLK
jgi:uncharacterized protein YggE